MRVCFFKGQNWQSNAKPREQFVSSCLKHIFPKPCSKGSCPRVSSCACFYRSVWLVLSRGLGGPPSRSSENLRSLAGSKVQTAAIEGVFAAHYGGVCGYHELGKAMSQENHAKHSNTADIDCFPPNNILFSRLWVKSAKHPPKIPNWLPKWGCFDPSPITSSAPLVWYRLGPGKAFFGSSIQANGWGLRGGLRFTRRDTPQKPPA